MKLVVLMIGVLAIAGCVEEQEDVVFQADTCGAAEFSALRGAAEVDVKATSFSQPVRLLGPLDMMTMDFLENRVNFTFDEDGKVARIWCG